ncbi:hypothetical protein DFH27DRAFT_617378 [Peziza echinospora]|nr:hypothetical protein DFH27DRAFT_617378 [Peziza echinospora]
MVLTARFVSLAVAGSNQNERNNPDADNSAIVGTIITEQLHLAVPKEDQLETHISTRELAVPQAIHHQSHQLSPSPSRKIAFPFDRPQNPIPNEPDEEQARWLERNTKTVKPSLPGAALGINSFPQVLFDLLMNRQILPVSHYAPASPAQPVIAIESTTTVVNTTNFRWLIMAHLQLGNSVAGQDGAILNETAEEIEDQVKKQVTLRINLITESVGVYSDRLSGANQEAAILL